MSSLYRRAKEWIQELEFPKRIISILVILFGTFVVGGGIYNLLENPPTLVPSGGRWSTIHPYMSEQTLNESIFIMIMTLVSFGGLYLGYRSTNERYEKKKANRYMLIGLGLLLLGVIGSYYLIYLKQTI